MVGWGVFLGVSLICLLAVIFPAPLQEPANPAVVPNPVKAGWFLLWIQEMVSWSKQYIYLVLGAGIWLVALPWLGRNIDNRHAVWWPRERRLSNLLFALLVLAVLILSFLALWFRWENWAFRLPWN
jgi:hypothetical protein